MASVRKSIFVRMPLYNFNSKDSFSLHIQGRLLLFWSLSLMVISLDI